MTGKPGRPTKQEAIEKAWQIIRDGCADGGVAFDVRAALSSIVADKSNPATSRVSACRLLLELDIAARNRAAMDAAGL